MVHSLLTEFPEVLSILNANIKCAQKLRIAWKEQKGNILIMYSTDAYLDRHDAGILISIMCFLDMKAIRQ
jgi:hypothetical protein